MMLDLESLTRYYDRFDDARKRLGLERIHQQACLLRDLIEDILELSRFDAKHVLIQKERFDLAVQCRIAVEHLELVIREKQIGFEFIAVDSSYPVHGDPDQLTRVIRNLLANAIKYTPEQGHIRVQLGRSEREVQLAIIDNGIGIAPEEQSYVFDRFYRTASASEMASGTGLGLAISRELIQLHQGRIELDSEPGRGSTFTVYLPIHE